MKCEKCSDRSCDFVEDCEVVKTASVSNSRLIDGLNALIGAWDKEEDVRHERAQKEDGYRKGYSEGSGTTHGCLAEQLRNLIKST